MKALRLATNWLMLTILLVIGGFLMVGMLIHEGLLGDYVTRRKLTGNEWLWK